MPDLHDLTEQELLTAARELDRLGRRVERYLSMQLQQLEIAIDRFERERTAWQRRRQAEIEQINHSKQALAAAWEEFQSREGLPPHQTDSRSPIESLFSQGLRGLFGSGPAGDAASGVQPPRIESLEILEGTGGDAAGTGSAPLKMLLDPGTASEEWLAGLLIEISKLNRELGGAGVRFELSRCHLSSTRCAPDHDRSLPFPHLLLDLELFSRQPLIAADPDPGGVSRDLLIWERFKSAMLLTSLADRTLSREFDKCRPAAEGTPARQQVTALLHRVEDANVRLFESSPPNAWRGGPDQPNGQSRAELVRRQSARLETVAAVIAEDSGARVHVSLI